MKPPQRIYSPSEDERSQHFISQRSRLLLLRPATEKVNQYYFGPVLVCFFFFLLPLYFLQQQQRLQRPSKDCRWLSGRLPLAVTVPLCFLSSLLEIRVFVLSKKEEKETSRNERTNEQLRSRVQQYSVAMHSNQCFHLRECFHLPWTGLFLQPSDHHQTGMNFLPTVYSLPGNPEL
jgi:hypothetical protein